MSFQQAWACSRRNLRIGSDATARWEWKMALDWSRPAFQDAYYNREPTPAAEALAALDGALSKLPDDQDPAGRVVEIAA
jgi:hypothetical protein